MMPRLTIGTYTAACWRICRPGCTWWGDSLPATIAMGAAAARVDDDELFILARKEGLMALETDSDAPDKSPIFSKYPKFLKDHHALASCATQSEWRRAEALNPLTWTR